MHQKSFQCSLLFWGMEPSNDKVSLCDLVKMYRSTSFNVWYIYFSIKMSVHVIR